MKKYLQIFKISFKESRSTYINAMMSVISFGIIIFIFFHLWQYLFANNINTTISGYSFQQMIWYLITAEMIAFSMSGRHLVNGINSDIRSGKISYMLNKPFHYYLFCIFNNMGEVVFKLILILFIFIPFGILLVGIPFTKILTIFPIAFSLLLSGFLASALYSLVGLMAFWTEDANPFYWIISKLTLLFGVFFPPELFPDVIKNIIVYSPIYSIYSGTAKLMANFEWELFFTVTISQILYIALFIGFGLLIYKKGIKKVNINGG